MNEADSPIQDNYIHSSQCYRHLLRGAHHLIRHVLSVEILSKRPRRVPKMRVNMYTVKRDLESLISPTMTPTSRLLAQKNLHSGPLAKEKTKKKRKRENRKKKKMVIMKEKEKCPATMRRGSRTRILNWFAATSSLGRIITMYNKLEKG